MTAAPLKPASSSQTPVAWLVRRARDRLEAGRPLTGAVIFILAGLLTFDPLWRALLPGGLYVLIHLVEGEVVTPLLLARRFTLNPIVVILSLIFWFWIWGLAGAILSVPILAITKIVCDRVDPLKRLGHLLEG